MNNARYAVGCIRAIQHQIDRIHQGLGQDPSFVLPPHPQMVKQEKNVDKPDKLSKMQPEKQQLQPEQNLKHAQNSATKQEKLVLENSS